MTSIEALELTTFGPGSLLHTLPDMPSVVGRECHSGVNSL